MRSQRKAERDELHPKLDFTQYVSHTCKELNKHFGIFSLKSYIPHVYDGTFAVALYHIFLKLQEFLALNLLLSCKPDLLQCQKCQAIHQETYYICTID